MRPGVLSRQGMGGTAWLRLKEEQSCGPELECPLAGAALRITSTGRVLWCEDVPGFCHRLAEMLHIGDRSIKTHRSD